MATFTETEITDIADIADLDSYTVSQHLLFYASQITASDKTRILAKITQWQGLDYIEGNVDGIILNPSTERNAIRQSVINLLKMQELVNGGRGDFAIELEKG